MARPRPIAVALALLVAAGVAFGFLGWRAIRLERDDDQRIARRRADDWLQANEGKIVEAMLHPTWQVRDSWRIVPPAPRDPLAGAAEQERLLFDEATFLERRRNDPAAARKIFDRLASDAADPAIKFASALAAGVIAVRAGDVPAGRAALEIASGAPPDLVVADAPVAAAALRHLVLLDAKWPFETPALPRLLDVCDDGRKLRADGGPDWGDVLAATLEDLAGLREGFYDSKISDRLVPAAYRAARGRASLVVAGDEAASVGQYGSTLLTRRADRLESRGLRLLYGGLWSQFRFDDGSPVEVNVWTREWSGRAARRLPPPLERYVATLDPRPFASPGSNAILALAAGLLVYVLGAAVAILAVRRSAKTARMQADFVAAVSHEMKTPVAAVQAMAEMLADGAVPDPARARLYAERMRAEMQRLGSTIRNVLDAARIERRGGALVALSPHDPAVVVESVAQALRPVLEGRGFRFDVDARAAARPVAVDVDALASVISNLLDNAAKFAGAVKEVAVKAGPRPGGFRIEVLDRGPGVPPRDRERVFERFFRGEAAKRGAVPGVGLGLHVAKELVEAHGGTLHVEDREGGGAAFVVDLPDRPGVAA